MYVIRNTETGCFVSRPGSRSSYTPKLQDARVFHSMVYAKTQLCVENEEVLTIEQAMGRLR